MAEADLQTASGPAGPSHPAEPPRVGARRATVDIAVQVIGRTGNLALGVVVTLIVVRALGSSGFGEWLTIFAITQIATNFGELGLNQVAISRAASDPAGERDWLGALVSLRLLLAVPTTVLALVGVVLIAPTQPVRIAGALIAATILVGAPSAIGAVFQLRVRNDITIAIMTLGSVLWGAGAIAVSILSEGIDAFAAVFLAAAVITTGVSVVLALRLSPIRLVFSERRWRSLLRVGLGVGAAGILVTLYVKLDQVLVFEYAGSRQAGSTGPPTASSTRSSSSRSR